jgi:phage shock protein A
MMANVLSRLKSLVGAGTGGSTDQGPEVTVDYGLEQLEKARQELVRSLGEIRLIQDRLKKQRSEVVETIDGYNEKARRAVESGRESQAKAALREKRGAEARLAELEAEMAELERQADELDEARPGIEREIALLQADDDSPQVEEQVHEALKEMPEELATLGHVIYQAQAELEEMESGGKPGEDVEAEEEFFGWQESDEEAADRGPERNQPGLSVDEELAQLKKQVDAQ